MTGGSTALRVEVLEIANTQKWKVYINAFAVKDIHGQNKNKQKSLYNTDNGLCFFRKGKSR